METPQLNNSIEKSNQTEKFNQLRDLVEGVPDAFFILVGAMKFNENKNRYESGSFVDSDENSLRSTGLSLSTGGKDRVFAASEMHQAFPDATIVPMSRTRDESKPTYATVAKNELLQKGVAAEKILLEENSVSTITSYLEAAKLWSENKWQNIVFITSDWHLDRAQALLNHIENFTESDEEKAPLTEFVTALQQESLQIQFLSSTNILSIKSDKYATLFEQLRHDEGMQRRVEVENEALDQIRSGTYAGRSIPKKIWNDKL